MHIIPILNYSNKQICIRICTFNGIMLDSFSVKLNVQVHFFCLVFLSNVVMLRVMSNDDQF